MVVVPIASFMPLSAESFLYSTSKVNIREKSSPAAKSLGVLPKGEKVVYLEKSTNVTMRPDASGLDMPHYWIKVRTPQGLEGWKYEFLLQAA